MIHGGDVWQVAREHGIPASGLLDFSANINPRGLPHRARERLARDAADPRLLACYPDPSARALRDALSDRLGVAVEAIVAGPGCEALLGPALGHLRPQRALVPIPAFSEYRRACEQQQIEFVPFPLDRTDGFRIPLDRLCQRLEPHTTLILNNPHNPCGWVLYPAQIRMIRDACAAARATMLLDEAFIDYVPDGSLVHDAAARPGLIVLRSLTKFYGCPALRVGYAVAHPDSINAMRTLLPAWPITQLASDALAEALTDREYHQNTLRDNAVECAHLTEALSAQGLAVFPSAANYLFVELPAHMPAASELRTRLIANHRILIRDCSSYEGLAGGRSIRLAVRTAGENRRLIEALSQELNA